MPCQELLITKILETPCIQRISIPSKLAGPLEKWTARVKILHEEMDPTGHDEVK